MAEVFEHPLTLAYDVGKNLIINGVDIYSKIDKSINSYYENDFFNLGYYAG